MVYKQIELKGGGVGVVRQAEVGDALAVIEYIQSSAGDTDFLTFGPGDFAITVEQERELLERMRNSTNQIFLVAQMGGEIVGTLSFKAVDKPRVRHVGALGMSVGKGYWGRGIGGGLLDGLIEWARDGGVIRKINLKVRADNKRAIRLYERKGFVREGCVSREHYVNGEFRDCLCMGLEVD